MAAAATAPNVALVRITAIYRQQRARDMSAINGEDFIYHEGDQKLTGLLVRPNIRDGARRPAVIVVHAFLGRTHHEDEVARKLGALGFIALAADCYGETHKTREAGFKAVHALREVRTTTMRARLEAALEAVRKLPDVDEDKICIIGYCFGGMCAVDMARYNANIVAAVSFHGNYLPIDGEKDFEAMDAIKSKLLILHGDCDESINPQVDDFLVELRARKADFQFVRYAKAKHGFTHDLECVRDVPTVKYDELSEKRSWRAMLIFFNELFNCPAVKDIPAF